MLLAAHVDRAITIQHGNGSLIHASPAPNGMPTSVAAWPGITSVPSISHEACSGLRDGRGGMNGIRVEF
jgi:hypothetical protein